MTFTGTIRFLVGAGLVAAGGQLAAPLAGRLAAAMRSPPATRVDAAAGSVAAVPGGLAVAPSPAAADVSPAIDSWSGLPAGSTSDSAGGLQFDRCPPPPPAPLPPVPREFEQAGPGLGAAYRSTLRVPPPDLLDAEGPPPTRSWAMPVAAAAAEAPVHGLARPAADLTVPATYRIQDGDDLSGIAGRFYGHPSAAAAIWSANRDTISDPDLLPIGAELRLPPSWAVRGHGRSSSGAIEPAAYVRPASSPSAGGAVPAAATGPWLPIELARPTSPTVAPAALPALVPSPPPPLPPSLPPAAAAMSVRVGPGETLPTLARRLYGDAGMAGQIFAVNRDRLRSPDLVVPGMELRLPQALSGRQP